MRPVNLLAFSKKSVYIIQEFELRDPENEVKGGISNERCHAAWHLEPKEPWLKNCGKIWGWISYFFIYIFMIIPKNNFLKWLSQIEIIAIKLQIFERIFYAYYQIIL